MERVMKIKLIQTVTIGILFGGISEISALATDVAARIRMNQNIATTLSTLPSAAQTSFYTQMSEQATKVAQEVKDSGKTSAEDIAEVVKTVAAPGGWLKRAIDVKELIDDADAEIGKIVELVSIVPDNFMQNKESITGDNFGTNLKALFGLEDYATGGAEAFTALRANLTEAAIIAPAAANFDAIDPLIHQAYTDNDNDYDYLFPTAPKILGILKRITDAAADDTIKSDDGLYVARQLALLLFIEENLDLVKDTPEEEDDDDGE